MFFHRLLGDNSKWRFRWAKVCDVALGPCKESILIYWSSYGRWPALRSSRYAYFSLILAIATCLYRLGDACWNWPNTVIGALPNILGFSLGGYAILIGFGDKEFLKALIGPEKDGSPSVYMEVSGAFVHFILIQVVALLFAFLVDTFQTRHFVTNFIGVFLFIYAMCSVVAATFAVLNVASWYDKSGDL